MSEPAYTRLAVDERRQQVIAAGARLFAEHSFEELSMRQIAEAAGISKPLLYHYFPSKLELFKAATADRAQELRQLIEPTGEGNPLEQLTQSLDAYLGWIEANSQAWRKLLRSTATMAEAGEFVEDFRTSTLNRILEGLTGGEPPRPALRNALMGWLAHVDAAILDWVEEGGLSREQVRNLILAAFGAALFAAQQVDPEITLALT